MTITAGEIVFVDTNVLLSATDRSREHHDVSRRLFLAAKRYGYHPAMSGQILREYLVVATRPVAENGLGLSTTEALHNAELFARAPAVFCDEPESVSERLQALARTHDLKGKRLHDANVVATMLVHGISRLVTHNLGDFSGFPEIDVTDAATSLPAEGQPSEER